MKAIDANIVLRFLTNDTPEQAKRCAELMEKIKAGEEKVFLPDIYIADIVWTLEKFYKMSRENIRKVIIAIVTMSGLATANSDTVLAALDTYAASKIDWLDSFAAAQMIDMGIDTIYTFDKHFDKIDGIIKIEP